MSSEGWANCRAGLVIGAGSLGFLTTAAFRLNGIHTYVAEIVPEDTLKIRLVKELGAHYVNVKNKSADEIIEGTGRLDMIIEAGGVSELALGLVLGLARDGICVLAGIPSGRKEVSLDANRLARSLVLENQIIMGSVNASRRHFKLALDDLVALHENYGPTMQKVISQRYPATSFREPFEHKDPGEVKSTFEFYRPEAIREAA